MCNLRRSIFAVTLAVVPTGLSGSGLRSPAPENYDAADVRQSLLKRVMLFESTENRALVEAYATSHLIDEHKLSRAVAATGLIWCPGYEGSANLTNNASVVTTAHHILCEAHVEPRKCKFVYFDGAEKKVEHFSDYGEFGSDCQKRSDLNDWAVLRLARPIAIAPYMINPTLVDGSFEGTKMTLVAQEGNDFCVKDKFGRCLRQPNDKGWVRPKYMADCEVKDAGVHGGVPTGYLSDCPTASGASGGALLLRYYLSSPVLIATVVGSSESAQEVKQEEDSGLPISRQYSKTTWFSMAVTVNGKYADAIKRASDLDEAGWHPKRN